MAFQNTEVELSCQLKCLLWQVMGSSIWSEMKKKKTQKLQSYL